MQNIEQLWGPYTWIFFHTLVAHMNNDNSVMINNIIQTIKLICKHLPCPVCREHATNTLNNYSLYYKIKTKEDLVKWVYEFHNIVNIKLKKPVYEFSKLPIYKKYNLLNVYNNWVKYFKIYDTDLHKTQEKQNINKTKILVKKFIILHKKHFIKY